MSESKPAPGEQFMTVRDFSQLVSKARDFLIKQKPDVLHSNRHLNTGWVKVVFDYTLQTESETTFYLVRPIRQASDLGRLRALLDDVSELIDSGLKPLNMPFALELILGVNTDSVTKADVAAITKHYAFVQQVIYLSRDAKRPVH